MEFFIRETLAPAIARPVQSLLYFVAKKKSLSFNDKVRFLSAIFLVSAATAFATPVITGQPVASRTVCSGTSVSFTVTATGTGLTYQWKKGGVNISGATSATYTIVSVTTGDAGNYTCVVSDGTPVTSNTSVLAVNAAPAPPTVISPVNYCQNATAVQLTATGTNLVWGSGGTVTGSVGGTSTLTTTTFVDGRWGTGAKMNFTTTAANVTITSVDYYITPYQNVTGLVLSIYNSSGSIIATSSTNTTQTIGGSAVKITNNFNYTIAAAGNYSIGFSGGYGNIGADNPSFPITEATGTIKITGVSPAGARFFNNLRFSMNSGSTAPTPSTTTVGSTNYVVTQTVNGCTSAQATITVSVNGPGAWNGNVSSDWFNVSNWCSGVPTATTDVVIPAGTPNTPQISAAGAICRNLTINSGAGLTLSTNGAISIGGNLVNNGTLNAGTRTISFNGTGAQTISSTATSLSLYHVTIAKTAGTTLSTGGSITSLTVQNLTQTIGNFTAPATLTINGNLSISAGNFTAPSGNLNIKGNFANNSTFTHNNGTVIFSGASLQTISGTSVTSFRNLTVNNAAGISLSSGVAVNATLTFSAGKIIIGNNNLTMATTGTISGASNARYVVATGSGALTQQVAAGASKVFPVGTSTYYIPATITFTAGSVSDNISVRVKDSVYRNGETGIGVQTNAVCANWIISEAIEGGSNATVGLQWPAALEMPGFSRSLCRVAHYTNGDWEYGSSDYAASGTNPYTLSRSGFTSFSPFGISNFDALPVKWIYFNGKMQMEILTCTGEQVKKSTTIFLQ